MLNFLLKECQEIVTEVTRVSMLMKTLQTDEDLYRQTQLISEATALLSTVISLSSCSSKSQRYGSCYALTNECYILVHKFKIIRVFIICCILLPGLNVMSIICCQG